MHLENRQCQYSIFLNFQLATIICFEKGQTMIALWFSILPLIQIKSSKLKFSLNLSGPGSNTKPQPNCCMRDRHTQLEVLAPLMLLLLAGNAHAYGGAGIYPPAMVVDGFLAAPNGKLYLFGGGIESGGFFS